MPRWLLVGLRSPRCSSRRWRRSRAGGRPRSGDNPGSSGTSCEPTTRVSPTLTTGQVLASLITFALLYALLLVLFLFLLDRKIKHGPEAAGGASHVDGPARTPSARCSGHGARRRASEELELEEDACRSLTSGSCCSSRSSPAYLVLDGFDLGVGMLHPFAARSDEERRIVAEQHRPDLGRQRGVARRRWRRPVRGVPGRLRVAVLGLLLGADARPDRPDPADGRDRVPQQARERRAGARSWDTVFSVSSFALAAPARRGVRERHHRRAAGQERGGPHRQPPRPAAAVRLFAGADHGRDAAHARRPVPGRQDRGRSPGARPRWVPRFIALFALTAAISAVWIVGRGLRRDGHVHGRRLDARLPARAPWSPSS